MFRWSGRVLTVFAVVTVITIALINMVFFSSNDLHDEAEGAASRIQHKLSDSQRALRGKANVHQPQLAVDRCT